MPGIDNSIEDFLEIHRYSKFLPKAIATIASQTTQVSQILSFATNLRSGPIHARSVTSLPFAPLPRKQDGLDSPAINPAVDFPGLILSELCPPDGRKKTCLPSLSPRSIEVVVQPRELPAAGAPLTRSLR